MSDLQGQHLEAKLGRVLVAELAPEELRQVLAARPFQRKDRTCSRPHYGSQWP
jgi:hypothetical protein